MMRRYQTVCTFLACVIMSSAYTANAEMGPAVPPEKKLIAFGESKADPKLKPVDLAAWTLVANLLLNLDEVVNKN